LDLAVGEKVKQCWGGDGGERRLLWGSFFGKFLRFDKFSLILTDFWYLNLNFQCWSVDGAYLSLLAPSSCQFEKFKMDHKLSCIAAGIARHMHPLKIPSSSTTAARE
jgi:hypothetical protein